MTDQNDAGDMRIEADLVRQLAQLLNENDLTEIEVEDGSRRIVGKREITVQAAAPAAATPVHHAAPAAAPAPAASVPPAAHPGTVKSPMVGTVYLSGEPG